MAEKLDSMTYDDLGIAFDEGLVWERLDARLGSATTSAPPNWMLAAAVFLGILLLPLSLLKEQERQRPFQAVSEEVTLVPTEATSVAQAEAVTKTGLTVKEQQHQLLLSVAAKKVVAEHANVLPPSIRFKEIKNSMQSRVRPEFAVEDISVIKESLREISNKGGKVGNGTRMSIRAQWQTFSSNEVNVDQNTALKIKLYESKN